MKLKHIAHFAGGGTPDTNNEDFWSDGTAGVPWVAIGDMSSSVVVTTTTKRLSEQGVKDRRLALGHPGTVLFAMYASVGAVATLGVSAVWNQALLGITPRLDLADSRFIAYWLQHHAPEAVAEARSATQANLNADQVANFPFPPFTLESQRRIADFLDDRVAHIDRIIAARREQVGMAELMVNSVTGRLLDDCLHTYGGAPLRRSARGIEQGSSPVGEDRPAAAGECGLLKTSAISAGSFRPERNKLIDPANADERYSVQDGDLLVTRGSGSADLVGDAAVAAVGGYPGRLFLSDLTYRVRDLRIEPEFAAMALLSPRGRSELGALVRQGSGPAKARGDDILSITVPCAPIVEQRSLVGELRRTRTRIETARERMLASVALLTEYKSSLITAAVTGELDVTTAGSGIPA